MTTPAPDCPLPPLLLYIDSLVEKLQHHLGGAASERAVTDIHQSRVATRRLKAALTLFQPVLSSSDRANLGRTTKKLRRRLGPLRDHDVMINHLAKLRRKRGREGLAFLLAHLRASREALSAELATRIELDKVRAKVEKQWAPLRGQMLEASEAIPSLLRDALLPQLEDFSQRADALSATPGPAHRADFTALNAPGPLETSSDDPHELRIAGKALRYTLEMYTESEPSRPLDKSVLSTFKRMQEHLGNWHDHVVLAEAALRISLEHHLPLHRPALQREILELSQAFLRNAERMFANFAKLWREKGTLVHDAIVQLFPAATEADATVPDRDATSI